MSTELELERCPFCNGAATIESVPSYEYQFELYRSKCRVRCQGCGSRTRAYSYESEAIKAWNDRNVKNATLKGSLPRTFTLAEVMDGARLSSQEVARWPEWKRRMLLSRIRGIGDGIEEKAQDVQKTRTCDLASALRSGKPFRLVASPYDKTRPGFWLVADRGPNATMTVVSYISDDGDDGDECSYHYFSADDVLADWEIWLGDRSELDKDEGAG